jgi:hypothetical protein
MNPPQDAQTARPLRHAVADFGFSQYQQVFGSGFEMLSTVNSSKLVDARYENPNEQRACWRYA